MKETAIQRLILGYVLPIICFVIVVGFLYVMVLGIAKMGE
jgi:hypothetical protein